MNVKIGILGCANIAQKYAIKAFQAIDNAEVTFIASRDTAKAKEWASRYNIRSHGSYEDLIKNKEVDAVYIPLPMGLHEEWIVRAATAGKHVISEKSIAPNWEGVKKIVAECKKHNVILYENFMCGFHPQHARVISILKAGTIGDVFSFQGVFGFPAMAKDNIRLKKELGGGSLNDVGAYTVFMSRKMLGAEPLSVSCNLVEGDTGVDVRGSGLMEFPGGRSALVVFSFDAVWGTRGLVRASRAYSIFPDVKPPVEMLQNDGTKDIVTNVDVPAANQFELVFKDFCDTIQNKQSQRTKIEEIYSTILSQARVLEAMRVSAKERRVVRVGEIQ